MSWFYNGKVFTSTDIGDNFGFVYVIKNMVNDRCYIGQKKFTQIKSYQKNGKRKRKLVESNWQDYYGSSETLKKDVAELGRDYFVRTIMRLCKSKGEMNYFELREQMVCDVLLSDDFYNDYCGTRIHRKHLRKVRERLLYSA